MRFQLLGPVEAYNEAGRIDLSAAKLRTVLATLLLGRGRVVSDSTLSEMLWGERPPATAEAQIQTYVSRLRQKLSPDVHIVRQRPGYLLNVPSDQLDLAEFERLTGSGRSAFAAGDMRAAAEALRDALDEWRGSALAGVTEHLAMTESPRLEEMRLTALEDRIEADLALGRHEVLAAELTGLAACHPLRERLRAQLMLTLYRCGRHADALAAYQDYRMLLVEELGIDPGNELRELHRRILNGDAALGLPREPVREPAHRPEQLPLDVADFTGREHEIAMLGVRLDMPSQRHGRLAACVLSGMAGVGKTALVVHVAHQRRDSYPDGQLYLDLRGSQTHPVSPGDALGELLTGLGADAAALPGSVTERAELYRARLADRRVLVVLDNAADERQVRPLLPGNQECGVLVTSRTRLTGLEGVPMIDLDVLDGREALELLAKCAGADRVAAEPVAAKELVQLCGRLPLGLRIAGARLAAKPHWPIGRLVGLLTDQRRRLDELSLAGLEVRSSVILSYQALDQPARRAFRLLSLLETPRFGLWTAVVVLDVSVATARDLLEQLVDARLLDAVPAAGGGQVHYVFHDLVRLLALEQAAQEETADDRYAALSRTLGM